LFRNLLFTSRITYSSFRIKILSFLVRLRFLKMYKFYDYVLFNRMRVKLHNNELSFRFKYEDYLCRSVFENSNIFKSCDFFNLVIFLIAAYKNKSLFKLRKRLIVKLFTLLFVTFV